MVHLIWPEAELGAHRVALEGLATKVTHVGHSASFVQIWLEAKPPPPRGFRQPASPFSDCG